MAERRMLSRSFMDSNRFSLLPVSAQMLYIRLLLGADDGLLDSSLAICRAQDLNMEDYDLLVQKGFLFDFPSGVTVIVHWHMHNRVRADRHHDTHFVEEFNQLALVNETYVWLPDGNQSATEDREGEESLGQVSPGEVREGFNQSTETRERVEHFDPDMEPDAPDEEPEEDRLPPPLSPDARQYLGGSLGRGLVLLSDVQMEDLLRRMSREEFDHYVSAIADCEEKGKHFRNKTHYRAMLEMMNTDRGIDVRKEGGLGRNKTGPVPGAGVSCGTAAAGFAAGAGY